MVGVHEYHYLPARARQEAVKPLNCLRACREKGNHEVTRLARGAVIAGWALAHHHQPAALIRIYFCYFTLSIDGEALDLGARKCLRTAANNPGRLRACTTTIIYRGRILGWRHERVCHSVGEGWNSPPTPNPYNVIARFIGTRAWCSISVITRVFSSCIREVTFCCFLSDLRVFQVDIIGRSLQFYFQTNSFEMPNPPRWSYFIADRW